ncbi:MAG TPA: hypothetical protein VMB71_05065 [Acetobacteraceae bacterium]|nr:hypothetical protein [Acetobacteraceae bacterium]
MRLLLLVGVLAVAACSGPVSPRQRAGAATNVAGDHPHPPGLAVLTPADPSPNKLRCWNNGEDTVCNRDSR